MFLRCHHRHPPGMVIHIEQGRIGELVQLLHLLPLDVGAAGASQDLGQPGPVGLAGNDLPGQRDVIQQIGQRPGRLREGALFFQNVSLDRDDLPGLPGFFFHTCLLAYSLSLDTNRVYAQIATKTLTPLSPFCFLSPVLFFGYLFSVPRSLTPSSPAPSN